MPVVGPDVGTSYPVTESEEQQSDRLPERPRPKVDLSDMAFTGTMSQFVEQFLAIEGRPFDFKGREYLRPIHDESYPNAKRMILKTGRQVEKCQQVLISQVLMSNGEQRRIEDVRVGDEVVSYDERLRKTTDRIVALHDNGTRGTYKVSTRLGHTIYTTSKHRLRALYGFLELVGLSVGSMIAGVRKGGEFVGISTITVEGAKVIAYLIGDGCTKRKNGNSISFTNNKPEVLEDFRTCVNAIDRDTGWRSHHKDKIDAVATSPILKKFVVEAGLWGLGSPDKCIPAGIFDLDREKTAAFLNALWATDGHVAKPTPCKYDIEYSSINRGLVKQVQNLLYKFGIPSVIREFTPTPYKGTNKRGYSVRVITQEGIRVFLTEIGALGKSEGIPLPGKPSNNNRDSIPKEIVSYLKGIYPSRRGQGPGKPSLHKRGLRLTPQYNLTYDKALRYIEFFDEEGIDCQLLKDLVDADVIWDQIESIEYIGEEHVCDIETEKHHNYVVDGIITHNSSTLAMKMIARCAIHPWFKSLYVSPSQMQTRQFSSDRVRANYERNDRLAGIFQGKTVTDQVFDKRLANGAMMYFRYAYLHPDRCRGISADEIFLDEIQDILTDNIPVIRECLSHSEYKLELYSGTPKTTSNSIEFYWERSTQNEWLVRCQWCNYWNLLGMDNIGEGSLVCSKCNKMINPKIGQWVTMRPNASWEGFRISQLMVPWVTHEEVRGKLADYSTAKFYNEVLGLPYDSGVKPLTEAQLRSCCNYGNIMYPPDPRKTTYPIFAGIDWGTGGVAGEEYPSYTVLALGAQFNPHVFTIFFMKRFMGPEADLLKLPVLLGKIFRQYDMNFTMSDWGYGAALNLQLRQAWGVQRIAECQYVTQNVPVKYEPSNYRYKVDRTSIMTEFFHAIKQQKLQFFDWSDFQTFGVDFLNIDSEFNEKTRKMTYNHRPDRPDDSFHAALYCWLAAGLYYKTIRSS